MSSTSSSVETADGRLPAGQAHRRFLDLILLFLLGLAVAYLQIGDFDIRLANDTLYHRMINADGLALDPSEAAIPYTAWSSIPYWAPAILQQYLSVDVRSSVFALSYLQWALLPLAVYALARTLIKRRDVAWLSAMFVLAAAPMNWNLSVHTMYQLIYAQQLALPFILFGLAAYANGAKRTAYGCFVLAAAIQPQFVYFAIALLVVYEFLNQPLPSVSAVLRLGFYFCSLAVLAALPSLAIMSSIPARLADPEIVLDMLERGGHFFPWRGPFYNFPRSVYAVIALVAAAVLVFWPRARVNRQATNLVAAGILSAFLVFVFATYGGVVLRSPLLLQLAPLRSTIFAIFLLVPCVILLLMNCLEDERLAIRGLAAVILISAAAFGSPLSLAGLLLLAAFQGGWIKGSLIEQVTGWRGILVLALTLGATMFLPGALALLSGISLLKPVTGSIEVWSVVAQLTGNVWLRAGFALVLSGVLAAAALGAAILVRPGNLPAKLRSAFSSVGLAGTRPVFVLVAMCLCLSSLRVGAEVKAQGLRDLHDAQVWARGHTPSNAQFITEILNWQTLVSKRPVVRAVPYPLSYLVTRDYLEHVKRMDSFYAREYGAERYAGLRRMEGPLDSAAPMSAYRSLDASGLQRFAAAFGGDYVVRLRGEPVVNLPKVYENASYVIYELKRGTQLPAGG